LNDYPDFVCSLEIFECFRCFSQVTVCPTSEASSAMRFWKAVEAPENGSEKAAEEKRETYRVN